VALSLELEERALEDLARALADATSGRVVPRVCGDTLG
jgi:hypothetical protein